MYLKRLLCLLMLLISCIMLSGCRLVRIISNVISIIDDVNVDATTTTQEKQDNPYVTEDPLKGVDVTYTYYALGLDSNYYNWRYINSIGEQKILVIPVGVEGYEENMTDLTLDDIEKTFFGASEDTYWESVSSFYYKSSYGKLSFSGEVIRDWMGPFSVYDLTSREGGFFKQDYDSMTPVLSATEEFIQSHGIDPLDYDLDHNGYIDLIWYVYASDDCLKDSSLSDDFWAFTTSAASYGYEKNYIKPVVNNFCWASYDFMYDAMNNLKHVDKVDAHTYIHETGHALGLDDYYDADDKRSNDPVENVDMMSANVIDHNSFSKFALGWINPINITEETTITLRPFSTTGDACIIALNYDGNAFGEYIIFEYFTPTGLNYQDSYLGYSGYKGLDASGIRIYHVDARLCYGNEDSPTIASSYSELKEKGGNVIFTAYSNTKSYAIVSSGSGRHTTTKRLISIIDRVQGDKGTFSKTLNEESLFNENTFFRTSQVKWHSSEKLENEYVVTFKTTSEGMTLTFQYESSIFGW